MPLRTFYLVVSLFLSSYSLASANTVEHFSTFHPEVRWHLQTGAPIYSTLVVNNDTAYVANVKGLVLAINTLTGKPRWRFQAGGAIYADVSLNDGYLYLPADDGKLYKLNSLTGKLAWAKTLEPKPSKRAAHFGPDGWRYRASAAAIHGDTLILGNENHKLYAINKHNGDIQWQFDAGSAIRATPLLSQSAAFFGTDAGLIYRVNIQTGKPVWTFDTQKDKDDSPRLTDINSTPVAFKNSIIVGSRDTNVYALDRNTGKPLWIYPYQNSWVETAGTIVDGILYLGSSFKRAQLALHANSGKRLWQANAVKGLSYAQLSAKGDAVYAGTVGVEGLVQDDFLIDGGLLKLDKKNGATAWFFPVEKSPPQKSFGIVSTPIMHENSIYFGGLNGKLYALEEREEQHAIVAFHATRDKVKKNQASILRWQVATGSSAQLNGKAVDNVGEQKIVLEKSRTYTLSTHGAISESQTLTVDVLPAAQINIAPYAHITSSSVENDTPELTPNYASDGDEATRWASAWKDKQWITLDFGQIENISRIKLLWENAYASHYRILASDDNKRWHELYNETQGKGGLVDLQQLDKRARYIKIMCDKRASQYGFSLYEISVYAH